MPSQGFLYDIRNFRRKIENTPWSVHLEGHVGLENQETAFTVILGCKLGVPVQL